MATMEQCLISAYYKPESMKPQRRVEFLAWYQTKVDEGYEFKFWEELKAYCENDVDVLMECLELFRKEFFDTSTVDPLTLPTIASACSTVYRKLDLPDDTVAIIPPMGYAGRDKQSHRANEYLAWKAHKSRVPIAQTRNGREIQAVIRGGRRVKLDGVHIDFPNDFNANRRGVEFAGCYHHGCLKCFHETVRHPQLDRSMKELHEEFQQRNRDLQNVGWGVEVMWECQWQKLKSGWTECGGNSSLS